MKRKTKIDLIIWGVIALIITILFILNACAPAKFEHYTPPKLWLDTTPGYVYNDNLVKPDKPKQILLDQNFQPTEDKTKARYVAFIPSEFAKIVVLNKLYNAQKEIINDHVTLVNVHINTINQLKELLALKDAELKEYISLWVDAENAYRQEKYDHKIDNIINRTGIYLVTIGSIILFALAL